MLRRPATTLCLSRDEVDQLNMELEETLARKDLLKVWNDVNIGSIDSNFSKKSSNAIDNINMNTIKTNINAKSSNNTKDDVRDDSTDPINNLNFSDSFKYTETTLNSELESDIRPINYHNKEIENPFYNNSETH